MFIFFPCSAAQHEQDLIVFLYFLFFGDVHFHYNISIISILVLVVDRLAIKKCIFSTSINHATDELLFFMIIILIIYN